MTEIKKVEGLARIKPSFKYSMAGLQAALAEPAIRLELWGFFLNLVLIIGWSVSRINLENSIAPENLSVYFYASIWAVAVLIIWLCVLVVEIINTAVETTVDYISQEKHPLAKKAKDLGSAAVFLALVVCFLVNLFFMVLTLV
jgi:diacylglycerol kinase (ATP)